MARLLQRTVVSGSIAALATLAAVAAGGVRRRVGPVAPVNATSHILWGREAGGASRADVRHTLPGLALHLGACLFWAAIYESLPRHPLGGPATAALAYVTDYHVVPRRLTPGWELRLPGRSLALVYAVLALSLPLGAFMGRQAFGGARKSPARTPTRLAAQSPRRSRDRRSAGISAAPRR
jgi:hypothetical protein